MLILKWRTNYSLTLYTCQCESLAPSHLEVDPRNSDYILSVIIPGIAMNVHCQNPYHAMNVTYQNPPPQKKNTTIFNFWNIQERIAVARVNYMVRYTPFRIIWVTWGGGRRGYTDRCIITVGYRIQVSKHLLINKLKMFVQQLLQ